MRRILIPQNIAPEFPLATNSIVDLHGETMGTRWSVRYAGDAKNELQDAIQQELDNVINEMSHWLPSSNLSKFNQSLPGTWHKLPKAFFKVLSSAMDLCHDSKGAYNPASGELINLWGFGSDSPYQSSQFVSPSSNAIKGSIARLKESAIRLNTETEEAYQPGGVIVDLSSIAKGYAVDRISSCLKSFDIEHHLVEIGGELYGAGMKPDGQPWWVALETPLMRGNEKINAVEETYIALHDLAIATSGDYRRYFSANENWYSHTIDPRNGYPINNDIASVTVIHESCMLADGFSTTLIVLGLEQGLQFAEEHNLAARFLIRHKNGFEEKFTSQFGEMLQ